MANHETGKRGFALLSKERLRQIASKGGKKAHEMHRAFEWNSEQARAAGKKGGAAHHAKRTAVGN